MWDTISDKISEIFEGLIQFLFESFLGPFLGLDTIEGLIFQRPESMQDETLIWGTFSQGEITNGLSPLYYSVLGISGFIFIIAIVLAGMRISSSAYNPLRRNELLDFGKEVIIVGLGFYYLPTLYDLLFTINSGIVGYFEAMMNTDFKVMTPGDDVAKIVENESIAEGIKGVIGAIFIQLILLGLSLWANFYYMMRRLTLLILLALGPLMMVFWMIPQFKSITGAWLKELTGSIFVNSMHAFVFFAVSIISGSQQGFIASLILYVVFIPAAEMLRNLFGMGGGMQGGLSRAGAMFGMSAIAGMAGAVKGAVNDKSVRSTVRGITQGVSDSAKGKGKGSAEGGSGFGKEEAFADSQSGKMLKTGDILGKAGKATLGMAGAVAGSGLGPLGSIAGAELGSKAGGVVAGATGRVGAAATMGLAKSLKRGKQSLDVHKGKLGKEDEVITEAIAQQQASNWAENNKEAVMNQLKQDFPNATPQDLQKKFNDMKKAKVESYKKEAQGQWKSAKDFIEGTGDGAVLVGASAQAMSKQWANDNKAQFMNDFEKQNPRKPGESEKAYEKRKNNAFNERVQAMKEQFMNDGEAFVQANGGESGIVSRKALANYMGERASQYQGAGNVDVEKLTQAANSGMEHVQGVPLYSKAGVPNIPVIANSLAAVKTNNDRKKFVESRMNSGATEQEALKEWSLQEPAIHQQYVDQFSSPDFQGNIIGKMKPIPQSTAQSILQSSSAFVGGMVNTGGFKNLANIASAGLTSSYQAFNASLAQGEVFTALPNAIAGAAKGAAVEHISQNFGDAVQAQTNLTRGVGYAIGVVFGAGGMQKAQKIMNSNLSPYTHAVQQQVSSPSEVIGMAQKIVDDNGVEQIPQGAIRQVVTRDASYVEVRTNSGEVRTVSRIGAGNAQLKQGETIYQDLVSNDGITLTTASSSSGQGSYYKVDSGGARIPVQVSGGQNPIELLGNPSHSVHAPVQRKEVPVLNQKVDMGNFYIEDLQGAGLDNMQVVVDKGQQYVTAQRDGITYRVSPIMRGNANLDGNQQVTIPVEVSHGRLVPTQQLSNVSVQATSETQTQTTETVTVTQDIQLPNRQTATRQVEVKNAQVLGETTSSKSQAYYDDKLVSGLIKSKHEERAERTVERRRNLDIVRRKQGF